MHDAAPATGEDSSGLEAAPGEDQAVTVTGMVEGLAGGWLSGWATDPAADAPCEIVVVDETDEVVASGLADRTRSDLAGYGFTVSNFAFRLAIPTLGASGALRVYADGAELIGSPVPTGAGLFDGVVSINDGWVEGWVHERRLPPCSPVIALHDQQRRRIAEGPAHAAVPPAAGDTLFAPARFRFRLDPAAWDSGEFSLAASANGVWFATAHAHLALRGHLERLDETGCTGWLMCPEAPSVRFEIELRCDGVLIDTTIAKMPRHDLREAFLEPWDVGFSFALKLPRLDPSRPHRWSLRLAGSGRELFEGPFVIGTPGSHIAAGRRLAQLARHHPDLDEIDRTVLLAALRSYIDASRGQPPPRLAHTGTSIRGAIRLSVVIPVYRDVATTRACIDSVLATRDADTDALVLVDDCSPDEGMAELLEAYAGLPSVHLLTNATNCGFIQSANRGLRFCGGAGDVLLLNSDTRVFAGGIDELWRAAHSDPRIGTATAMSNNATIFSYPVANDGRMALDDIGWEEVAAVALQTNAGVVLDVPTAHGFCMLIRREMLERVGLLDEAFGRGYGEENDFCLRGLDLGFGHVAAAGVFVEHRESVSFTDEKQALLTANLARLEARYPEYAGEIRDFLRRDGLRAARWPLDRLRLQREAASGTRFVLIVRNWLQGGTQKAIDDIAGIAGYGAAVPLDLSVAIDGTMRLACENPRLCAVFGEDEHGALWRMLEGMEVSAVLIHQLLGFNEGFIAALRAQTGADRPGGLRRIYYLHDFHPLCPRVTMIDAVGAFCDVAPVEICERCVEIGGAHDASRLTGLTPGEHRALFASLLGEMDEIVVPSANAAGYLGRWQPGLGVTVRPHPEPPEAYDVARPAAIGPDVVLLGAIGPHKGSGKLLEIAQRARLVAPELRFHVIGYTDVDAALIETGVVTVSGPYQQEALAGLVAATGAAIALFLHRWPETFSYTLSEAVQLGLIPVVPDIGAPADRVRAAGYGVVYGFPIEAAEVLRVLADLVAGRIDPDPGGSGPCGFAAGAEASAYRGDGWFAGGRP